MTMDNNKPYSQEELKNVGDSEFPKRGLYCPQCKTNIPLFEDLDDKDESRIKELIRNDRSLSAIEELTSATGCNDRWAKIWVIHKGKPSAEYPGPPCPHCGKPLRTTLSKQCPHCFMEWHNVT